MKQGFVILDFGSQVSQLIARRLREMGYFSELLPYTTPIDEIKEKAPKGIILSGGPNSVFDKDAPYAEVRDLIQIAPLFGICYGMQLLAHVFGGVVESSDKREYGDMWIEWKTALKNVPREQKVWMSHGDVVKVPPPGFEVLAFSKNRHPAAMRAAKIMAVQFHPEVAHTEKGTEVLKVFCEEICQATPNWTSEDVLEHSLRNITSLVPEGEKVLCALSGGVDSTVVGKLLTTALGADRVVCVFVDNGLLRKNEFEEVLEIYKTLELNVTGVDAKKLFLERLSGVSDPEEKRKIIGHTFIDVFKSEIKKHKGITHLAQGTLYPDVIESVSPRGASVTIKSHHNVGGLPKDLNLKLVEPLRELFKDEVRIIGDELKIPRNILWRHPFPGPGLAIRVLGEVSEESLHILREADAIYIEELKKNNLYSHIWQAFAALLPVKSVGVQGDGRTYEKTIALRAVTSSDGMTADWFSFPHEFLRGVSNRITNEVRGVNRVVYDITSKPPGTIEWE
ncbi:MAG: glutamine-hydrolyzing GMP synthase [Bdellovibrionales bacterium]|nr:glutamine-hydrolyzing GMP synthase [Bdellovibrionales bacterium]